MSERLSLPNNRSEFNNKQYFDGADGFSCFVIPLQMPNGWSQVQEALLHGQRAFKARVAHSERAAIYAAWKAWVWAR